MSYPYTPFNSSAVFQDTSFYGCSNDTNYTASGWDMINPLLFLIEPNALCKYANVTACGSLDNGSPFSFFRPFCMDLLPFCIFYSFIRVLICLVNYFFIYRKKIERRIRRTTDSALLRRAHFSDSKNFTLRLHMAFLIDLISSIFTLCVFNGYQYYASQYNASNDDDFLLGQFHDSEYIGKSVGFFFIVLVWFLLECWRTYIQIFSVSSLTHLDNLKRESQRETPEKFYKKHQKFSTWWTVVLFAVGFFLIFVNFFWKIIAYKIDPNSPVQDSFESYKLHYKYYSTYTVSFWLSYSLILILILTDRILAYEGFKKRQEFRVNERRNTVPLPTNNLVDLSNYQILPNSASYRSLKEVIARKFAEKNDDDIEHLTKEVADKYSTKMREHFANLKDKMKTAPDDTMPVGTSLSYVKFLRSYNVLNLLGYAMMLFTYQHNAETQYLPLYLLGFIVSAISTFAFDLIHNYMLYRSFFLQVLTFIERQNEENEENEQLRE